jgi:methylsterol monooxygenase
MQNDTIATGIMSFVMHEFVYFGRSLPWIIIDAIPFFNKYKLQNVSAPETLKPKYTLTAL